MKNTFIKMLSVMMAMVIALGACAITVSAEDEPAGGETGAVTTPHECSAETLENKSGSIPSCVGTISRYKECTVCGKIVVDRKNSTITPDAHFFDGEWTVTGDAASGWQKVNHCYLCDTDVTIAIPDEAHNWKEELVAPTDTTAGSITYTCDGTTCIEGCPAVKTIVILAGDGSGIDGCTHENKAPIDEVNEPCKPTYTVYECADCGNTFIADFVAATSHDIDRDTLLTVDATCDDAGYTYYACNNCTHREIVEEIPAGHRDAEGNIIDTTCGSTLSDEGADCVMCSQHFDRADHNHTVTDDFAGDCQNAPYTTYTCDACGDTYTDPGTLDPTAHVYQPVGEPNTDVFVSNIGTKVECSVCHDTKVTNYLYKDLFFSFEIKNSSDTETAKYAFVNGGHKTNNKVIVELYIHSYDADAINTMQFDFKYNTSAFELNAVTANTEIIGKKDINYNETSAGTIRVVYAASNVKNADDTWELGALALSNEPVLFATVELNIKDSYYDANGVKKLANIGSIDMGTIVIADTEHNELYATAQDIEPIYIYKRGDISGTIGSTTEPEGDGKINAVDLSWMLEIVANGDYTDVRADVNLDGVIDSDDFALMRNWLLEKVAYPATK